MYTTLLEDLRNGLTGTITDDTGHAYTAYLEGAHWTIQYRGRIWAKVEAEGAMLMLLEKVADDLAAEWETKVPPEAYPYN